MKINYIDSKSNKLFAFESACNFLLGLTIFKYIVFD
jgi:hypothetical protein